MIHFSRLRAYLVKPLLLGRLCIVAILCLSYTHAQTILVHGDSLSAGYGMNPSDTWVALIAEELGSEFEVVNSSISGETSKGGLERLPVLLDEHSPDILILELGANDGLRGYPIAQMQANLAQMIELAEQQNTAVLLVGIRMPPNFGRRFTEPFFNSYKALSEQYDTAYLPFLLEGVAQFDELMQDDGLHPNESAQAIIKDNVYGVLKPMLGADYD